MVGTIAHVRQPNSREIYHGEGFDEQATRPRLLVTDAEQTLSLQENPCHQILRADAVLPQASRVAARGAREDERLAKHAARIVDVHLQVASDLAVLGGCGRSLGRAEELCVLSSPGCGESDG